MNTDRAVIWVWRVPTQTLTCAAEALCKLRTTRGRKKGTTTATFPVLAEEKYPTSFSRKAQSFLFSASSYVHVQQPPPPPRG